jgi:hypothetical protein
MTARHRAYKLLEQIRATPMRRGALSKPARRMRSDISRVLGSGGVPEMLAQRIAFQLVIKVDLQELADKEVWQAIAAILREEMASLTRDVGLAERQIIAVLPKLSAVRLEELLNELTRADRRIARTVLDAAIYAADPVNAGRRYVAEYRLVVQQLQSIEPTLARTLANATFTARTPLNKAMEHLEQFLMLVAKEKDNPDVARLLARAGFRSN